MSIVDLHIHTNFSDGEYSIEDIIKMSKEKELETISITDHDTLSGIKYIAKNIKNPGINIIPGIELTSNYFNGKMHILGYNIDYNNKKINELINKTKENSVLYIKEILEILKEKHNIEFPNEDVELVLQQNKKMNRVDIAMLLIKYRYVSSNKEAFDNYLDEIKPLLKTIKSNPHPKECIEVINASGGIAVLAHPVYLDQTDEELKNILEELISYGLRGIEVYNSRHSKEEIDYYINLAEKYNLTITGGSDYHGPKTTPQYKLGEITKDGTHPEKINVKKLKKSC